jgi:RNA polymerase sigma-70 factor (ECF subfamily)
MSTLPTTRHSLLVRLRDLKDAEAWGQFVDLYAPVLHGFYRKRGLQDADAADLTQQVLESIAVGSAGSSYDRARGKFRNWLLTIAQNRHYDWLDSRRRHPEIYGDASAGDRLEGIPAPAEEAALWERQYEQHVYAWAAERVRQCVGKTTWEAFKLTAVEGKSGEAAAHALGISVGAVYVSKSRVLNRLRKEVDQIEGE